MLKTDTKNAFLPFTTSGVPAAGLTLTWPEHGMNMEHMGGAFLAKLVGQNGAVWRELQSPRYKI